MTKLCKRLGVGLAAAALLLGLAGLQGAGEARAQQPNPPATFAGTVMIDGEDAPSGTAITVMMGDTTCATGQTGRSAINNSSIDANRYALQVDTADCDGDLSFMVGGMMAAETANTDDGVGQVGAVNLTAMSAMETETPDEPDAMETPDNGDMEEPDDPDAMETPDEPDAMETPDEPDAMGEEDDVPGAGQTGTGLTSTSASATTTLAAALGALALAVTLGGVALARRRG